MRSFIPSSVVILGVALACGQDTPYSPGLDRLTVQAATFSDCPPPYTPGAANGSAADRNGDGVVCRKTTNGGQDVEIDNNARRPGKKA